MFKKAAFATYYYVKNVKPCNDYFNRQECKAIAKLAKRIPHSPVKFIKTYFTGQADLEIASGKLCTTTCPEGAFRHQRGASPYERGWRQGISSEERKQIEPKKIFR